jgi:peroxiredoxin
MAVVDRHPTSDIRPDWRNKGAQWISAALLLAGVAAFGATFFVPTTANHPVTPAMLATAERVSGRTLPAGTIVGADGRAYSPAAEAAGRPLVLVFVKEGCPCSIAAEPFFRRLHDAYGSRAAFLGVIDGDRAVAKSWAEGRGVHYPVLADPDHRIIDACGVENSASVALVARGGTIEALWPGYSAGMLADLGARLSRHTGLAAAPVDAGGAPAEMTSGCSF